VNWIDGNSLPENFEATAKIRYKAPDAKVEVEAVDHQTARVRFLQNQRDITPGQSIVFYYDELVLGGGTISWSDEAERK
jgi:tRNA-specific 2-thiouridylase